MAGYGYSSPAFSTFRGLYSAAPRPPRPPVPPRFGGNESALARAAAGRVGPSPQDPFGLGGQQTGVQIAGKTTTLPYGMQHEGGPNGSKYPARPGQPIATPPPPGSVAGAAGSTNTAPTAQPYDINTDPAFQSTVAATGMSDEQANAAALKDKQQALLGYGDANLVQKLLGDSTLAQAAGANPTSVLAQLSQQRGRNVNDLTEALNKANLLYSGYRVNQEQQAGQDYQNQLAAAASSVNGNLGSIDAQLAAALGNSQQQRIQAMQAAEAQHAQDAYYQAALGQNGDGTIGPGTLGTASVDGTTTPGAGNVLAPAIDPQLLALLLRAPRPGSAVAN